MPRLFILSGPDLGLESEIGDRGEIGRGETCAVRLRDGSVSRHHARLEKTAAGYELVDLESRNGISRAGERAVRIPLKHGDEVTIGSVLVRFVDAPAPAAPAELDEIVLDAAEPAATVRPAARAAPSAGAARRRAIAGKEGVLQFHRIEDAPASILRDDMGQYSGVARVVLVALAIAAAGGLFYGAWKLTSVVASPPPAEPSETSR
ncbi:MAG TPA: FHA domain-containing protein [Planctomycetota bacterium]|nr:FHA domain-containing protein [Planctomycetota bacterium]